MALITRGANASMDISTGQFAPQISGLLAGEALDAVAPCYIHSDGKIYMSNGTADDAEAKVDGFTPRAAASGQPITIYGEGTRFNYGSSLTPGATYYLGATNGRLDGAATTGDAAGIARAVSATDIVVLRRK